ncbi:progestin and adipoQ receptor family member 4 [Chelonus insularis]|uniref:progestin and adipoQ receptor family member 4 n=1 Tax=Chelonus insularis TaxID=460826 RepID=UPI0015896619|nr:progestin and adipoQ receptor family member 4 [Chelonus insularis]
MQPGGWVTITTTTTITNSKCNLGLNATSNRVWISTCALRYSISFAGTLLVRQPRNADVRTELAGEVTKSFVAAKFAACEQDIADNFAAITADSDITVEKNVQKPNSQDVYLKSWSEMPTHLQFNPHIKTGYRPITDIKGCLVSLFYFHNETVNILTHGLAILYILLRIPNFLPWWDEGVYLGIISWCHFIGAISPWIGSFTYHLFMNLNYGEAFYKKLLKLDMLGIWVCQSVGAVPMISASVHCLPAVLWHLTMLIYVFLSLWGLLKAMKAKSPWERRLCFSPPFMMRMIFLVLRYFNVGGGAPDGLTHIILQDLVAVIGGTVGALRIPEKWLPGQVDFMLNSHNIMHVIVVVAVWSMHEATMQDIKWMMDPSVCLVSSSTSSSSFSSSPIIRHDEL